MFREARTSITQLVKDIANEEIDKRIKNMVDAVKTEHQCKSAVESIINELKNIGAKWEPGEEKLLIEEVNVAISQIAANHGRSIGAIRSKLNHLGIMN